MNKQYDVFTPRWRDLIPLVGFTTYNVRAANNIVAIAERATRVNNSQLNRYAVKCLLFNAYQVVVSMGTTILAAKGLEHLSVT